MKHRKFLYGPGRDEYVSEFARFIDGYLQAHPEVRRDQMLGWRIWWERPPADPRQQEQEQQRQRQNLDKPPYHSYYYE